MLPINLDAAKLPIALIGDGPRAARRLELLLDAGAANVSRVPPDADLSGFRVVYVADFDEDRSREIASRARAAGALVNVEDVTELCDFHTPAMIRRGDLTVTVATGGRAPGLAGALAAYLGKMFGAAWALRLDLLEAKRRNWRAEGLDHRAIREATERELAQTGWLPDLPANADASDLSQSANNATLRKASLGSGQTSQ